jgi:hypothetical protein
MSIGGLTVKALDRHPTLSSRVQRIVETGPAGDEALAYQDADDESLKWQQDWQRVIDYQLLEWVLKPEELAEEGLEPPTRDAISIACKFAVVMRDTKALPPNRVAPNGDGGIVFEGSVSPGHFQALEIKADGSAEFRRFQDCHLVQRLRL